MNASLGMHVGTALVSMSREALSAHVRMGLPQARTKYVRMWMSVESEVTNARSVVTTRSARTNVGTDIQHKCIINSELTSDKPFALKVLVLMATCWLRMAGTARTWTSAPLQQTIANSCVKI